MFKRISAWLTVVTMGIFGMAAVASAEPTEVPGQAAIEAGFDQMTDLITTVLVPALFGLVILGLGIALGVKWLKKGSRHA